MSSSWLNSNKTKALANLYAISVNPLSQSMCVWMLWYKPQILIVKTEVRQWGNRGHRKVIDAPVWIQRERHKGIFNRAVAPMGFEGVVLPMLQVGHGFRSVFHAEDQP